ncbi:MAG: hypothetical protein SFZ02_03575 [bacterium]|nr:hypothetical protein [bacterium]
MSDIDLESAISQFYEDESLTEALTDQPAKTLLKWGEQQLGALAQKSASPDEFDEQFTQLRKLIKNISRFVAEHQDMAEEEQQEAMQKMMTFAQNIGVAINGAVGGIIEEQKSLSDEGSVTHLLSKFVASSVANLPPTTPTTPPSVPPTPSTPVDSTTDFLNSPVEDITEILPKGGLLNFINQITARVNEAKNQTSDADKPNPDEGIKPSAEDDEF